MPEVKKLESEEPKTPTQKSEKPKSSKKIWWWLGGGCCCLLLVLIVFISLFTPFIFSFFRSSADIPIPNLSSSSTPARSSPTVAPTKTPDGTPTSANYPAANQCQPLQLVDAVPIEISPSDPGLKQDIDTHYYQVYGYTPYEVRAQLNECGSKSGGESYDAYTSYYTKWMYNYRSAAGGCNIGDVTVGIKVDFFYPKWEDPGNAEAGLAERWQTYMANLITHEEGHKDIAIAGAQDILSSLLTLPDSATCDGAGSLANSTGNSIFADYDARNKAYDAETGHGATQGAVFP